MRPHNVVSQQIADLKRFNGLLSDQDLYSKDMILIPTKLFPVGEEVQLIFAQIAAGVGRDPVLHSEAKTRPASASAAMVARALHIAEGVEALPTDNSRSNEGYPTWCRCGLCSDDDDPTFSCKRHTRDQDSVELVHISSSSHTASESMGAASSRMNDQVRRRRGSLGLEDEDVREDMAFQSAMQQYEREQGRHRRHQSGSNPLGSSFLDQTREFRQQSLTRFQENKGATIAFFSSLSKAIGDSNLTKAIEKGGANFVEKLKKVSSQPALAGPGNTSSLRDAADGVLASLKQGLLPKGPLSLSLPVSTGASSGRPPKPPAPKDDYKAPGKSD